MENSNTVIEPIYDRVTEVLRPFTGVEFVDKDILDTAAERGNKVHSYIEGYLKGIHFQFEDEVIAPYVQSFKKFWEASSHAFKDGNIILEKRLFCSQKKITGKADVIIEVKGQTKEEDITYIIDWKTSVSKNKSWALQGAAYKYLCIEEGYENVEAVLFVRLSKHGKSATINKDENYEENLEIFLKCLDLYRYFDMKKSRNKGRY